MADSIQTRDDGAVLAVGFGMSVAMWAVGYFARLFGDAIPAPWLFGFFVACVLAGGFLLGTHVAAPLRRATLAGLLSGGVNLLIVGSLISGQTPNAIRSGAWLWVPAALVASVACCVIGCLAGRARRADVALRGRGPDWTGGFGVVAAVATLVLLAAGGLVTGFDEGLAVVDWPNSEGYNMFLYPLSRMTGGVYLEHAHRLLGSLVGLTTLALAIHTQISRVSRRAKGFAWFTFALVVGQGLLGGLRVTGKLTLSTQPTDTDPKVLLAIVHGVFGQIVFAFLVALALMRSRAWTQARVLREARGASTDRFFAGALIGILIVQLVFGALVRHFTWALSLPEMRYGLGVPPDQLAAYGTWAFHVHVTIAVVVALLTVGVGVRAWGLYRDIAALRRLGLSLLLLVTVQLALGIAALVVTGDDAVHRRPTATDVAITTAHQVVGAALLAWAVLILLWNIRLVSPARAPEPAPAVRA